MFVGISVLLAEMFAAATRSVFFHHGQFDPAYFAAVVFLLLLLLFRSGWHRCIFLFFALHRCGRMRRGRMRWRRRRRHRRCFCPVLNIVNVLFVIFFKRFFRIQTRLRFLEGFHFGWWRWRDELRHYRTRSLYSVLERIASHCVSIMYTLMEFNEHWNKGI